MPRNDQHAPPTSDAWCVFGCHRLRAPSGMIIDLPLVPTRAGQIWVARIWPDPDQPAGWARQLWTPIPQLRGWQLPYELAAGDVIEFGADSPDTIARWYGVMDSYEVDRWATVQGPYDHPSTAYEDAQRLLDLERHLEPLRTEPHRSPQSALTRTLSHRHLTRHRSHRRGRRPI